MLQFFSAVIFYSEKAEIMEKKKLTIELEGGLLTWWIPVDDGPTWNGENQ